MRNYNEPYKCKEDNNMPGLFQPQFPPVGMPPSDMYSQGIPQGSQMPPNQLAAASDYPQEGRPSQFPKEGRPSTYPLASNVPSYTGQPLIDKYIHSFIGTQA